MEIRDIRIDNFGCWEDTILGGIPTAPSTVHLDDGGQSSDFSRFLHRVLYGFDGGRKTSYGGSLTLVQGEDIVSVDRQQVANGPDQLRVKRKGALVSDSERWLRIAQAATPSILADRFFVPTEKRTARDNLQWLSNQPDLISRLFADEQSEVDVISTPHGDSATGLRAERHAELDQATNRIEQLALQQEHLRDEIAELELERDALPLQPVVHETSINAEGLIAEMDEELRRLKIRLTPYEMAARLAPRWYELYEPTDLKELDVDFKLLNRALRQYRQAEEDKQPHQTSLSQIGNKIKPKRNPGSQNRKRLREIDRLLAKQEWILNQDLARQNDPPAFGQPVSDQPAGYQIQNQPNLKLAEQVYRDAEAQSIQAQRNLQSYLEARAATGQEAESAEALQSEIALDSPLRLAPLNEQLDELSRRRRWLALSHQSLVERQTLSAQWPLWITILFVLSILTVFGTQIVVSYWWQLAMTALGLGGMVAAGALKAAIQKRSHRLMYNSLMRLRSLDAEIEQLTAQIQENGYGHNSRVASQRTLLEEAAAVASARLVEATDVYQQHLAVEEAHTPWPVSHPTQRRTNDGSARPPAFLSWIEDAKRILAQSRVQPTHRQPTHRQPTQGQPARRGHAPSHAYSASPSALISQLKDLRQQLSQPGADEPSFAESERDVARKEIRRLEKLQRSILQRVEMPDVYDLEAAIDEAQAMGKQRKTKEQAKRRLTLEIDQLEDGEEVRELLQHNTLAEVQRRIDDLREELAHVQELRDQNRQELRLSKRNSRTGADTPSSATLTRELTRKQAELQQLALESNATQEDIQRLQRPVVTPKRRKTTTVIKKPAQIPWLLSELTNQQFETVEFEPRSKSFLLRGRNGELTAIPELEASHHLMELVWLAISLRLGMIQYKANAGNVLPFVVSADAFDAADLPNVFRAVSASTRVGLQVCLLTSKANVAEKLAGVGAPVLRVGLKQKLATKSRMPAEYDELGYSDFSDDEAAWAA